MQNEQPFADVLSHISAGRLKEALDRLNDRKLDGQRTDNASALALAAELQLGIGNLAEAERDAQRLLRDAQTSDIRIAAHRVLGEVHANRLEFESGLDHFRAARALCGKGIPAGLIATLE